jgi:hypothetical protein
MSDWRVVTERYPTTRRFEMVGRLLTTELDKLREAMETCVRITRHVQALTHSEIANVEVSCENLMINGHGAKAMVAVILEFRAMTPPVHIKFVDVPGRYRDHFRAAFAIIGLHISFQEEPKDGTAAEQAS